MKNQAPHSTPRLLVLLTLLSTALAVLAQTPVDEDGKPLGPVYADSEALPEAADERTVYPADETAAVSAEELLSADELAALIGPIALYPDDLLAVVLPASTYPLQIVQAARYLDLRKSDSSLQPDDEWDDSVVALLNYPEVLEMMSDDIDWTWRLGEAVVAQQGDVVAAVENFRDRAYAAGNLKSDERQKVSRNNDEVIVIEPVEEDVIYVPYYEPERVVVYQTDPVYHYYPRAYPVYYYPYPAGYHFGYDYFWGVTTAYQIGWYSNHLQVFHHSYYGHPYYGRSYYGNYWRRPSIQIFNTWYGGNGYASNYDRSRYGSYWRPRRHGGARPGVHPARDRYYSDRRRSRSDDGYADRDTDRRDYRRDDRQYNGQVGRRAAANNDTPRATRRSATDNSANRDVPARAERGESAESRRGATPRLRNRETATDQRDIARAAQDGTRRSSSGRAAERTNERADIRFRDRSGSVNRAATSQRARTAESAPVTARSNVQSRAERADSAPARTRSAGADTRDRMQTNGRDNRRSGVVADARRTPQPRVADSRVADSNERVRQAQAPRARTNPVTPRTTAAPARMANRDATRSAAPQQRQARQSVAPPRQASAPAAPSARRETAAPQRSAASRPAPQRRSAERQAPAADSSRARSSRGGDRRRDRD